MRISGLAAAVVAACISAASADAAMIVYQSNFAADYSVASGAPVSFVSGAYKVTYNSDSRAVTINNFVLNVGGVTYGTADLLEQAIPSDSFYSPHILLSGKLGGHSMGGGTDDFSIGIFGPTKTLYDVSYTSVGTGRIYSDFTPTMSAYNPNALPVPPSTVPEPAAWLTMIAGFAAIGCAMRRRRRLGAVA